QSSNYTLELPEELQKRRIHPTFHVSLLRRHMPNDDQLFPRQEPKRYYDFGSPDDEEWFVDAIVGHEWRGDNVSFQVLWSLGDHTWEPLDHVEELEALDQYLALQGVEHWRALP
ncbi:hypothetical protein BV25DRAFT_1775417, partial [Artomyces pyxidatus]